MRHYRSTGNRIDLLVLSVSVRKLRNPTAYHQLHLVSRHVPVLNTADFSVGDCQSGLIRTNTRKLINGRGTSRLTRVVVHVYGNRIVRKFRPPTLTGLHVDERTRAAPTLAIHRRRVVSLYTRNVLSQSVTRHLKVSRTAVHGRVRDVLEGLGYGASHRTITL